LRALYGANVGAVNPRAIRESLLREADARSYHAQVLGDEAASVHWVT